MTALGTRVGQVVPVAARLRVARAALLLLTILSTLVLLVTTPLEAQEGEFIHALRSGEVRSAAVGHSADFASDFGVSVTNTSAGDDIAVSWVGRSGFRRVAVLSNLLAVRDLVAASDGEDAAVPTPAFDPSAPIVAPTPVLDPLATIAATARSLGSTPPIMVQPGGLPLDRMKALTPLLVTLMMVVLIVGPRPRRMSKAGAFWAYLAPFNIGIFYALLRDSPWNRRMNLVPEPGARDRVISEPGVNKPIYRHSGWAMFVWSVLLSGIAFGILQAALRWALPTYFDLVTWIPVNLPDNQLTTP
jgi:hypothetical protein